MPPYRQMFPDGYAKGYGPGFGPFGPSGPDGPEHGPAGKDKKSKSWTPDPRKMAAGWVEADYDPADWPAVAGAIANARQARLDEFRRETALAAYRQHLLESTKSAEENYPIQLSAERHTQRGPSPPPSPQLSVAGASSTSVVATEAPCTPTSVSGGLSTPPKTRLILHASPPKANLKAASSPKLTIKINPKLASPPKLTIKINPKAAAAEVEVEVKPKLWDCCNLNCDHDDMTCEPREDKGRKFISDFFGRNKTQTKTIPQDVWNFMCRKDYQRSKYASEKSADAYNAFWLPALKNQLIRIQLWRPEATFELQLLDQAEERLNKFNAELAKNGGNVVAAQQALLVIPTVGKKALIQLSNVDAIDPVQAQYIKTTFAGIRSIDYILQTVCPWIEQSLASGTLLRMPPIECLIVDPEAGDTINSPTQNRKMWLDYLSPKWNAEDHKAALALLALSGSEPHVPMNLTEEAHKAAVDAEEIIAAATAAALLDVNAETQTKNGDEHVRPAYKGKGKGRMIEEGQEAVVPKMTHNTHGKKRKAAPAAAEPSQKRRLRSSTA